jgi:hypothetical protein
MKTEDEEGIAAAAGSNGMQIQDRFLNLVLF